MVRLQKKLQLLRGPSLHNLTYFSDEFEPIKLILNVDNVEISEEYLQLTEDTESEAAQVEFAAEYAALFPEAFKITL